MKWYIGKRDADGVGLVYVYEGVHAKMTSRNLLPLEPSMKLANHSPDGFDWGYNGSGPAQLALALLLDVLGDRDQALRLYQAFKENAVATWEQGEGWLVTADQISQMADQIEAEKARRPHASSGSGN